jgi:IS5 family transposase
MHRSYATKAIQELLDQGFLAYGEGHTKAFPRYLLTDWPTFAEKNVAKQIASLSPTVKASVAGKVDEFKNYVDELQKKKNRSKSRVRAKVEHPFRILKRIFGFDKVRYRGIAKNHHRLCPNFALVNLYLHRKRLAVLGQ